MNPPDAKQRFWLVGVNLRWRMYWPTLAWAFWAGAILAVYYRQMGRVFSLGPAIWLADQYSLRAAFSTAGTLVSGPPFWAEALVRALNGIWAAVLILLAAQFLGAGFFRLIRWQPDDRIDRFLYRMAIGFGGLAYLSLALAALGMYRPWPLQASTGLIVAGGLTGLVSKRRTRPGLPGHHRTMGDQAQVAPARGALPVRTLPSHPASGDSRGSQMDWLWKCISILAVFLALIGALAPEKEYDALWYHLELPRVWLEQGRPVDLISEYVSLYPLSWEMLYGLGLVLSGQIAAKLLHFASLVLGGLLVYQWVRVRFGGVSPWLAVVLFVTIPTVFWEATTAYTDLALAYFTGLAFYALLRFTDRQEGPWLTLAALSLGLALASKHLALFGLAIAVPGLAIRLGLKDGDWRRALPISLRFGILSLLLPLPWYLRSWLASGNPVFPDLYAVFGAFPPERWSPITEIGLQNFKDQFGDGRALGSLLALPWNMTIHAARYGGSLGPLFLAALPALVLKPGGRDVPWVAAALGLYLALWASPVSSFQLRFLVPITPLLAVLAAQALQNAGRGLPGPLRPMAGAALAGLLLLNLPPFLSLHEGDRSGHRGWLTHVVHELPWRVVVGAESQDRYLARSVPSYRAWQYINTHLPSDATVLTFSGGDHYYSQRPRLWSEATVAHPAVWGAPAEKTWQALTNLRLLGVDYVLHDARLLSSPPTQTPAITDQRVLDRWFALEYQDDRYRLYRLLDVNDDLSP